MPNKKRWGDSTTHNFCLKTRDQRWQQFSTFERGGEGRKRFVRPDESSSDIGRQGCQRV